MLRRVAFRNHLLPPLLSNHHISAGEKLKCYINHVNTLPDTDVGGPLCSITRPDNNDTDVFGGVCIIEVSMPRAEDAVSF